MVQLVNFSCSFKKHPKLSKKKFESSFTLVTIKLFFAKKIFNVYISSSIALIKISVEPAVDAELCLLCYKHIIL